MVTNAFNFIPLKRKTSSNKTPDHTKPMPELPQSTP